MSNQFQSIASLVIAAGALAWLVRRHLAKRRNPGCGGDCGCAAPRTRLTPENPQGVRGGRR